MLEWKSNQEPHMYKEKINTLSVNLSLLYISNYITFLINNRLNQFRKKNILVLFIFYNKLYIVKRKKCVFREREDMRVKRKRN